MRLPERLDGLRSVRVRREALRRAWPLAAALLVIAVIASGLACSDHGRPTLISAFLLPDMLVDLPVRPVTWITAEPTVEQTFIDYGSGRIRADIYRPGGGGRHAAVIFSMGAPPLDLDDNRLEKLAEDVARAGLVMVVPFSERLDRERIEPEEIEALAGIFRYLEEQPYVDAEHIGYIGVSVGGSLALVAAAEPAIAERVDFVVAFGAYYDALDLLQATGTGQLAYDGETEAWEPDPHTVEVMALQLIKGLPDADDRSTLCKAFVDAGDRRFLCDPPVGRDDVTSLELARLSTAGRAAYDLMTGAEPERFDELVGELPAPLLAELEELSPVETLDRVDARKLYIIHDRGDEFIPYVESRRLRDALGDREGVHYTEVSLFEHVEPRLSRGGDVLVIDSARLYFRLYQLLLELT